MRSKRHVGLILGLALVVGLVGVTYVATAQVTNPTNTAAVAEFEKRNKAVDRTKVDDLYGLAKWCFQNNLTGEAKALALEILQKTPDDVRAKYLLYILAAGPEKPVVVEHPIDEPAPGITEAEADAIYAREGDAMKQFGTVQPLFLTSCGPAKCHGGQNPAAKWFLIKRDPTSKLTKAENFRTINRYIDRDDLANSRLFVKPLGGKQAGHPEIILRANTDPYLKMFAWAKTLKTAAAMMWEDASKSTPPPAPTPTATPTSGQP